MADTFDSATKQAQDYAIEEICYRVGNKLVEKQPLDRLKDKLINAAENALDILTAGTYSGCSSVARENTISNQIACAKGVVDLLSIADPIGILTIAGTFLKPVCDLEPKLLK